MSQFFGFECFFISSDGVKKKLILEYLRKFFATLFILFTKKPDVVWIQLPPLPALTAAAIYKLFSLKKVRLVGDCHNSMLRSPWATFPTAIWHLNFCDVLLVHNLEQLTVIKEMGVKSPVEVLEDAPATMRFQVERKLDFNIKPKILFPASFSEDEPIAEVFAAAELIPEMEFYITGNIQRATGRHDLSKRPSNVILTGFLSLNDFEQLFSTCDVILGFTKYEGIQLSVCNEAVGAGKPMVLSQTKILQSLFYKGSEFVDSSDPASIAKGCRLVVENNEAYSKAVKELCLERVSDWRKLQAEPLLLGYLSWK